MYLMHRFFQRLMAADGVVALEFALIAPVLLLLFFGADELATAFDCRTRVTDAAASTADLVAQRSSVSLSDMKNIFCAAKAIISPYNTSGTIRMVVSGINCSAYNGSQCTAMAVGWSMATPGASVRTTPPDASTLPLNVFLSAGSGIVMVEMQYRYSPATTQLLGSPVQMRRSTYAIPRGAAAVSGVTGAVSDCSLAS